MSTAQENPSGATPPKTNHWQKLFQMAVSIINQANAQRGIRMHDWTFGGGTALMLQIDHRESYDIDIFISGPQYLPYLNPMTQDYKLVYAPYDYRTDGFGALKIQYPGMGEIDFICAGEISDTPFEVADVLGRSIRRETVVEIIAKKIFYRGNYARSRDMFDIAAASIKLGEGELIKALAPIAEECASAVEHLKKRNAEEVQRDMQRLVTRPDFDELHLKAYDMTIAILESVRQG